MEPKERRREKGEISPGGYKLLARRVLNAYENNKDVKMLLSFIKEIAEDKQLRNI